MRELYDPRSSVPPGVILTRETEEALFIAYAAAGQPLTDAQAIAAVLGIDAALRDQYGHVLTDEVGRALTGDLGSLPVRPRSLPRFADSNPEGPGCGAGPALEPMTDNDGYILRDGFFRPLMATLDPLPMTPTADTECLP